MQTQKSPRLASLEWSLFFLSPQKCFDMGKEAAKGNEKLIPHAFQNQFSTLPLFCLVFQDCCQPGLPVVIRQIRQTSGKRTRKNIHAHLDARCCPTACPMTSDDRLFLLLLSLTEKFCMCMCRDLQTASRLLSCMHEENTARTQHAHTGPASGMRHSGYRGARECHQNVPLLQLPLSVFATQQPCPVNRESECVIGEREGKYLSRALRRPPNHCPL